MDNSLSLWERESARSRQREMLAHTPVGAVRSQDHSLYDMLAACPHFKAVARVEEIEGRSHHAIPLTEGHTETIMHFAIVIYDEPQVAALRDQYRQTHLDYLKVFDAQTLFAGPFTTDDESADLGSLRLIEFPDRAAANRHVAEEPYVTGGVQKRWHIHRWLPRLPYSWRDCPRTKGNIQAMFHGLDQSGSQVLRQEFQEAHEEYLVKHASMVMARGPLVTDDGETSIGSVLLLDVPDMVTVRAFMEQEPFYSNGVYQAVNFHRWRFGRVMDRFK